MYEPYDIGYINEKVQAALLPQISQLNATKVHRCRHRAAETPDR